MQPVNPNHKTETIKNEMKQRKQNKSTGQLQAQDYN